MKRNPVFRRRSHTEFLGLRPGGSSVDSGGRNQWSRFRLPAHLRSGDGTAGIATALTCPTACGGMARAIANAVGRRGFATVLAPKLHMHKCATPFSSGRVRVFSTLAVSNGDDCWLPPLPAAGDVRMRFADADASRLDVGFTDGTAYRFGVSVLDSLAGRAAGEGPSSIAGAVLSQGSAAVTLTWGNQRSSAESKFDSKMLRDYADELAKQGAQCL